MGVARLSGNQLVEVGDTIADNSAGVVDVIMRFGRSTIQIRVSIFEATATTLGECALSLVNFDSSSLRGSRHVRRAAVCY